MITNAQNTDEVLVIVTELRYVLSTYLSLPSTTTCSPNLLTLGSNTIGTGRQSSPPRAPSTAPRWKHNSSTFSFLENPLSYSIELSCCLALKKWIIWWENQHECREQMLWSGLSEFKPGFPWQPRDLAYTSQRAKYTLEPSRYINWPRSLKLNSRGEQLWICSAAKASRTRREQQRCRSTAPYSSSQQSRPPPALGTGSRHPAPGAAAAPDPSATPTPSSQSRVCLHLPYLRISEVSGFFLKSIKRSSPREPGSPTSSHLLHQPHAEAKVSRLHRQETSHSLQKSECR